MVSLNCASLDRRVDVTQVLPRWSLLPMPVAHSQHGGLVCRGHRFLLALFLAQDNRLHSLNASVRFARSYCPLEMADPSDGRIRAGRGVVEGRGREASRRRDRD